MVFSAGFVCAPEWSRHPRPPAFGGPADTHGDITFGRITKKLAFLRFSRRGSFAPRVGHATRLRLPLAPLLMPMVTSHSDAHRLNALFSVWKCGFLGEGMCLAPLSGHTHDDMSFGRMWDKKQTPYHRPPPWQLIRWRSPNYLPELLCPIVTTLLKHFWENLFWPFASEWWIY